MPEIAEVARIVHFLRLKLVGKLIANVSANDDANVFGKAGTTGSAVEKALKGKKVVSAGSQGKYFWITFDKAPHLVMHFGMTGWVHIKGEQTAYTNYYKKMKDSEKEQWPPKFWKFQITTEGSPAVEVAFTDPRRFGRVRLIDCPGEDIRKHSPLVENGPDPVIDLDVFTEEYLKEKMRARRVPIKALLLDQAMISGIGNWVADETLYQAKLHPEQYCDEFGDAEVSKLFEMIRYVCQTAVDKLAESDDFPEHWLFNYRWGKGAKGAATKLPNGEKLAFITVGGRTSCYAPGLQKKTGKIAPGAKAETVEDAVEEDEKPKKSRKAQKVKTEDAEAVETTSEKKRKASTRKEVSSVKAELEENGIPPPKKRRAQPVKLEEGDEATTNGRRRSTRLRT